MKRGRKQFFFLCAVLLLTPLATQAAVTSETVSYASGDETVQGYLARPEDKGPFPAIVVIHEWWGLNDQIKSLAEKFAGNGYVALAVDLYRGRVATDRGEARELSRGLPRDRAVRDLKAAVSYLRARRDVHGDRIGSIGWCMGGGYSLALALNQADLAAAVIYYGRLVTEAASLRRLNARVIGFFGEEDRGIPVASVRQFESQARALGKSVTVHIYPGASHAFANDTRPSYRPQAARDAWEKTLAFFAATLKR
ncbi:MAG: dienelactone hydrolase family protein [Terriglobia bacterium]